MGKDKFKQIKKMEELLYSCPKFLCDIGIFKISGSGIFQNYGKKYSKYYEIKIHSEAFHEQEFAAILRSYDIQYKINRNILTDKQYLMIWLEGENFHIVYQEFGKLEEYINGAFSSIGLTLRAMQLEERLRLVNLVFRTGMERQDMNITDYVHSISEWKEDFGMSGYDFTTNPYVFCVDSRYFTIFYLEKCNINYLERIEWQLMESGNCMICCKDFAPVSDSDIKNSLQNNYMGLGNIIGHLKRDNPELYRVYTEEEKEDSRGFIFAGAMYLYEIKGDITEELQNIKETFLSKQGAIKLYAYQMKQALSIIAPTGNDKVIQYRMFQSKECGKLINLESQIIEKHEDELPIEEMFV